MTAKLGGVYVQSTICGLEAREQGFDEAIFLNMEGRVARARPERLIVKDGVLITTAGRNPSSRHHPDEPPGDRPGPRLQDRVRAITKSDFFGADEAFYCGTAVEVIPIVTVTDGSDPAGPGERRVIGTGKPGPVALRMIPAFQDAVSGRDPATTSG